MKDLLAKLSEQQVLLEKQKNDLSYANNNNMQNDREESIPGSVPLTPATDSFNITPGTEHDESDSTVRLDSGEMIRLKKELDAARDKIARQEQELSQTRVMKHTLDQAMEPVTANKVTSKSDAFDRTISSMQDAFQTSSRTVPDDSQSDFSDALSNNGFNRTHNIWSHSSRPAYNVALSASGTTPSLPQSSIWGAGSGRAWTNRPTNQTLPQLIVPQPSQQQRTFSGPSSPTSSNGRFINDFPHIQGGSSNRRQSNQNSHSSSVFSQDRNRSWDTYGMAPDGASMNGMTPVTSYQPMGLFQAPMAYQPRPIGTPLSPTAAEFSLGNIATNPWNSTVSKDLGLIEVD